RSAMNDHDPQLLHVRAPLLHLTMQPESVGVLPEPTGPLLAVRGPLMHLTAMPITELTPTQQPLVRVKATFEMVEGVPQEVARTKIIAVYEAMNELSLAKFGQGLNVKDFTQLMLSGVPAGVPQ
ncbi:MAG: hypothetical protein ACRCZF_25490, partial [Gemmataceae bacterium]